MDKNKVERLKVLFEVTLGTNLIGTYATMQKANTAAKVANRVASLLGDEESEVKIREVVAKEEEKAA